jgi:hypothetical protein
MSTENPAEETEELPDTMLTNARAKVPSLSSEFLYIFIIFPQTNENFDILSKD